MGGFIAWLFKSVEDKVVKARPSSHRGESILSPQYSSPLEGEKSVQIWTHTAKHEGIFAATLRSAA